MDSNTGVPPDGDTGVSTDRDADVRIEVVDESRLDDLVLVDELAWSASPSDETTRKLELDLIEPDRFRVAYANDRPVGVAGAYSLELTLPGGATVPMAGLAWVGVLASHRRHGIMRGLVESLHADSAARNEPLTGLTSSQGGIYGRFGYRPANFAVSVEIDAQAIRFVDDEGLEPGIIELRRPNDVVDEMFAIGERHRHTEPGAVGVAPSADGESGPERNFWKLRAQAVSPNGFTALHADGFATYLITQDWDRGHPRHVAHVRDFIAATPEAHLALWKYLCGIDLVVTITANYAVASNDPLYWLVTDRRAIRVTDYIDDLWLRVVDVAWCFGTRSYRTDDALVVAFDDDVYRISPDDCEPSTAEPDLFVPRAEAGALVMGAVPVSSLVRAGRVRAASPTIVGRADALFGWDDPASLLRAAF